MSDNLQYQLNTLKAKIVKEGEINTYSYKNLDFKIYEYRITGYYIEYLDKTTYTFVEGCLGIPNSLIRLKQALDVLNKEYGFTLEKELSDAMNKYRMTRKMYKTVFRRLAE